MHAMRTDRLLLRELNLDDASFILELVNSPAWLRFIGSRNIMDLESARQYLRQGPFASYAAHGFGLWAVQLHEQAAPIGLCGLLTRPELSDVDIGFAFLERYWGHGYAREAAAATLVFAREHWALRRVVAITTADNQRSAALLLQIGMHFQGMVQLRNDPVELCLYARDF